MLALERQHYRLTRGKNDNDRERKARQRTSHQPPDEHRTQHFPLDELEASQHLRPRTAAEVAAEADAQDDGLQTLDTSEMGQQAPE